MFTAAYHDIPWEEPELVKWGMEEAKGLPKEKWMRLLSKMGLYQP
jgi:hypothetical protein